MTFSRRDRWKTAQLEWRGYAITDCVSASKVREQSSTDAVVNMFLDSAKVLMEDIGDQFPLELYVDGYGPGNRHRMHGFQSFASGRLQSGKFVATPNTIYAGLSTAPGAYGGSPGDKEFDFWSPLLVDWSKGSRFQAIMFGMVHRPRRKRVTGRALLPRLIMLHPEMYEQLTRELDGAPRIVIDRPPLASIPGPHLHFNGSMVAPDVGVPEKMGFGIDVSQIELRSLQSQLFCYEGPDLDTESGYYRHSIDFFGNLAVNPHAQFVLNNYREQAG